MEGWVTVITVLRITYSYNKSWHKNNLAERYVPGGFELEYFWQKEKMFQNFDPVTLIGCTILVKLNKIVLAVIKILVNFLLQM